MHLCPTAEMYESTYSVNSRFACDPMALTINFDTRCIYVYIVDYSVSHVVGLYILLSSNEFTEKSILLKCGTSYFSKRLFSILSED